MRLKFSLLTLVFFSLMCGAGLGLYWNTTPWKVERSLPASTLESFVQVAPDGSSFLYEARDDVVECHSMLDGRVLWTRPADVVSTEYTRNSRWVLSRSNGNPFDSNDRPRRLDILDAATGAPVQAVALRGFLPGTLTPSPSGRYLIHSDGSIHQIWDMRTGRTLVRTASGGTGCYPTDEFLAERKRIQAVNQKAIVEENNLIAYLQGSLGPRESFLENDIERRDEALELFDDPDYVEPSGSDRVSFWHNYALSINGCVSNDGSRMATQIWKSGELILWDCETLQRLASVPVPYESYLVGISTQGKHALLIEDEELLLVELPSGRLALRKPGIPEFERNSSTSNTKFSADGRHVLENFSRKNAAGNYEFINRVFNTATHETVQQNLHYSEDSTCLNFKRSMSGSSELRTPDDSEKLFTFRGGNDEELSIQALFPDGERVLTMGPENSNVLLLWKNVRPEQWWGVFWCWELYAVIVFGFATAWSVFRAGSSAQAAAKPVAIVVEGLGTRAI